MKRNAGMDIIHKGQGYGSVASRLLANGLNTDALRTNDTLTYDEWKEIDNKVLMAFQERLVGVADVESRGLVYSIPNGLGKTVLAYQHASDLEDAEMNMDGITRTQRDRPEFDINYLPLPICHADFSFSIREIEASRNGDMPLDTTTAEIASIKVAQKIEKTYWQGLSTYTFGGGTLYGVEDYTNISTGSVTATWADSGTSGTVILSDVRGMKQASINAKCYGPWILYVSTTEETKLDEDFKANSDKSIRERLLEVSGIEDVKVADFLTAGKVALVQMRSDTVRIVNGLDITTVQWEEEGGMRVKFKVMAIKVPQFRADVDGNCGIVVYS